jgi:hypothetical protein
MLFLLLLLFLWFNYHFSFPLPGLPLAKLELSPMTNVDADVGVFSVGLVGGHHQHQYEAIFIFDCINLL